MKIINSLLCLLLCSITWMGCEKRFEKLRLNPNNPDVNTADVDLYLNQVQVSFNNFWGNEAVNGFDMNSYAMSMIRMEVLFGPTYANAYSAESFNTPWDEAYTGVFKHANELIPQAIEQKQFFHVSIALVLKAYTMMTLADFFGDVPFKEANLGLENTNPKPDPSKDVYASAILLLDSAINNLAKTQSASPKNDIYYGGDKVKWRKLAKTLKLRAYLITRLVDTDAKNKITTLINENDIINTTSEEFTFKYGTSTANPITQHPKYVRNYTAAGGATDYIGTHFIWGLIQEKGLTDPRTRYYLYRQNLNSAGWDEFTLPCGVQSKPAHYTSTMPFCILSNGYWGRDHGNNDGIPPDNDKRTTWGVYPAGGKFDNSEGTTAKLNEGGKGAGISPIWMAFSTDFAKAEAALTLQTPGNPRALLEAGVKKSIERVLAYPSEIGLAVPSNRVPTQLTIDTYVGKVLANYDNAANDNEKLNVIMTEWYLALWGNGIDAYNNYRRTAMPNNFQLPILSSAGLFIRTFYYPADFANLNINVVQKTATNVKTFWDTNPDNLYR